MGTERPSSERLRQLSRIFATPIPDDAAAAAAITARAAALGSAFFLEAADSDDVVDEASAFAYLDGRLAYFDPLLSPQAAVAIRAAFADRLRAWA
ncbi:MAG: hypothetical protein ACRDG3_00360 [Tepidiformaceae bacterium]